MRKTICVALVLCLCAALPLAGVAEGADGSELLMSATVIPRQETALKATATGALAPFTLRAGDSVAAGDVLFEVDPQTVYADMEGAIATVYAQPGDIADAAMARYGAIIQIEYKDRYILSCNNASGYDSTENRNLYVGAPVYLRSADEKHFADGLITSVDGRRFVVEVIGGDLVYNKDVKVYRMEDYNDKSLLARKTLLETVAPADITASGTILTMHVKPGDEVKPGDLLFTYVPDSLSPELRGKADATLVKAPADMVLSDISVTQGASVQKDQVLALGYKTGDYQLRCEVGEGDLHRIATGDTVKVVFEELKMSAIDGTVTSVSSHGSEGDTSKYAVYIDFDVPDGILVGMNATIER